MNSTAERSEAMQARQWRLDRRSRVFKFNTVVRLIDRFTSFNNDWKIKRNHLLQGLLWYVLIRDLQSL